jgi:cytochrome c oxidase assembly protein subunit 15
MNAGYHDPMPPTLAESRRLFASRRAVGFWLLAVAAIIVGMVTLGGLTRITGSGLSITEWDPIMGAIPPLNDAQWHDAFAKYQQIPQYRLENHGMSLEAFKSIFWWEWTHRLLGRLLGVVFFVPFLWFAWTGAIARREWPRMLLLFALGGLQGFVGWWMVQSGLETRVSVSQYRLAIHLGVAIILLGAILWTALQYLHPPLEGGSKREALRGGAKWALALVALVYIQMLLGALVAGLHGGLIYNTWPSMDGRVFPEGPFNWLSPFEDAGLAQFNHRIGAYVVFIAAIALTGMVHRARPGRYAANAASLVGGLVVLQVGLGIATLLWQAPLALSALHQVTAALLFCAAVWQAFELRYPASA